MQRKMCGKDSLLLLLLYSRQRIDTVMCFDKRIKVGWRFDLVYDLEVVISRILNRVKLGCHDRNDESEKLRRDN